MNLLTIITGLIGTLIYIGLSLIVWVPIFDWAERRGFAWETLALTIFLIGHPAAVYFLWCPAARYLFNLT